MRGMALFHTTSSVNNVKRQDVVKFSSCDGGFKPEAFENPYSCLMAAYMYYTLHVNGGITANDASFCNNKVA